MESHLICQFLLLTMCIRRMTSAEVELTETDSLMNSKEHDNAITTENTAVATTVQSFRHARWYRRGYNGKQQNSRGGHEDEEDDHDNDDHDMDVEDMGDMKAISQPKTDYWGGYYDFLINEGSYKFWAVFQLATAALLIYSGFAALYYAKVNPPSSDDYEDYFLRKRKRRSYGEQFDRDTFLGLSPQAFQRIIDAVEREFR